MTYAELVAQIRKKRSFLCVGLDSDYQRIPGHLHQEKNPVATFNRRIVDATADKAVAFKLNLAFYEELGQPGWAALQDTADYIHRQHPDTLLIADAKRGDIGNTAEKYARAFFEDMPFDAITVSPYMGEDTVIPFLKYSDKWVIVLALTSNPSAADFQMHGAEPLYKAVIKKATGWGPKERVMFVAGATRAEEFRQIRELAPGHFLLVPGVGAQGGSLKAVAENGLNASAGLLVNSSRGIIFAGSEPDFDDKARESASLLQSRMENLLVQSGFLV